MTPADQGERDRIRNDLNRTLLVEAAAGTGKTQCMVDRMVALVCRGVCEPEQLAAVTFTRTAAAELKERYQRAIRHIAEDAAHPDQSWARRLLPKLDQTTVGTIHAFCGRMLRERPFEAGVEPGFVELDETEDLLLRERAWREHLEAIHEAGDPLLLELEEHGLEVVELGDAFQKYANYPDVAEWPASVVVLDDLEEIHQELEAYARHMEELVGPSADPGKDSLLPLYLKIPRMLRHVDPSRPVDVMRVAEEFKSKARANRVQKVWPGGKATCEREYERWEGFVARLEPSLARWRAKRYEVVLRFFEPIRARYDRMRREAGGLNFQDLLMKARDLLRAHPQARRALQVRYRRVLVDEFQDTDPVQAEVLWLLTSEPADSVQRDWRGCRPRPGALFVVGDPKQSIYRFRRADIVTYKEVKDLILRHGGDVLALRTSFRTVKPVVDWVNACFSGEAFPLNESLLAPVYVPLSPHREAPEGSAHGVHVLDLGRTFSARDVGLHAEQEAQALARWIRSAVRRGLPLPCKSGGVRPAEYGDFLILTRKKDHLITYAAALRAAGVPCQVLEAKLEPGNPLVLLHGLALALIRRDDPVAMLAVLRGPLFGISDRALHQYKVRGGIFRIGSAWPDGLENEAGTADLRSALAGLVRYAAWLDRWSASEALERIAADVGIELLAAQGGHLATLERGFSWLRDRERTSLTHAGLIEEFGALVEGTLRLDQEFLGPEPSRGMVRLMNLHKAKGLEAPVVFLIDPHGVADRAAEIHVERDGESVRGYLAVGKRVYQNLEVLAHPLDWEAHARREAEFLTHEEIRLMYVAATRAGAKLVIGRGTWRFFQDQIREAPTLELNDLDGPDTAGDSELDPDGVSNELAAVREQVDRMRVPTYESIGVRRRAEGGRRKFDAGERVEPGTAWGRAIHQLLEHRMKDEGADLKAVARAILEDEEIALGERLEEAVELVESVTRSEIWQRARHALERHIEVPFTVPEEDGAGGFSVLRGQVDLAFREAAGWVIVDFKTDQDGGNKRLKLVKQYTGQVQTYARVWARITGQPVCEAGLLFTRSGTFVRVV
jgi:ATP-dependent helicase/nuclease subunit A